MAVQIKALYRHKLTGEEHTVVKREHIPNVEGHRLNDGTIHSGYVVETDQPSSTRGKNFRMEENTFLDFFKRVTDGATG